MNAAEAVRRIYREIQDWDGDGAEVSWTKNGLNIALKIVRTMAKEEQARNRLRRPRLARWKAADLYYAINVALRQLHRGDRALAVDTLERAANEVKESRTIGA